MAAVGVLDDEIAFAAEQLVDRVCRRSALVDTLPPEVAVVKRRVDKKWPGSQGAQQLVEVERDLVQLAAVVGKPRHVADLAPALAKVPVAFCPIVVVQVRVKSATAGQNRDPRVEHGRVNRVVATQRMADGAEAP